MYLHIMKLFFAMCLIALSLPAFSDDKKDSDSGAWADIKSGVRKVVRGGAKGVKKVAGKVENKMDKKEREAQKK